MFPSSVTLLVKLDKIRKQSNHKQVNKVKEYTFLFFFGVIYGVIVISDQIIFSLVIMTSFNHHQEKVSRKYYTYIDYLFYSHIF